MASRTQQVEEHCQMFVLDLETDLQNKLFLQEAQNERHIRKTVKLPRTNLH